MVRDLFVVRLFFHISMPVILRYLWTILYVFECRERGDNGLFITLIPKLLKIRFLIRWLNNFGDLIKFSVQTFQPLILIYRRGNFMHHHWGCTPIYPSLCYPFRSLIWMCVFIIGYVQINYRNTKELIYISAIFSKRV